MQATTIDNLTGEKDLGVLLDVELNFHIKVCISKLNRSWALAKRTFDTLAEELLPTVYKQQVRPHPEEWTIIWHPHYAGDICMYTERQPSYRDIWNRTAVKSVPTSFRSIYLLTIFFINALLGPIFSFLCCLQFSFQHF